MLWLVVPISDTGMRLAEVAGLLKADIVGIYGDLPYVRLIKNPWRNLKTESRERRRPLVGQALWAVQRAAAATNPTSQFMFSRYNTGETTSANSASAALNTWLSPPVPKGCTMQSFRPSLRDRLRAVQCLSESVTPSGGWTTDGAGQSYGRGYPVHILANWVSKATTTQTKHS